MVRSRRRRCRRRRRSPGGDDYELLFAVPREGAAGCVAVVREARGVPVTRIGELTADPSVVLLRDGRPEPLPAGFVHF